MSGVADEGDRRCDVAQAERAVVPRRVPLSINLDCAAVHGLGFCVEQPNKQEERAHAVAVTPAAPEVRIGDAC